MFPHSSSGRGRLIACQSRYCATNTGKKACATKNARMKAGIAGLKARSTKHSASNEM
jgi:hypothetical protein